MGCDNFDAEFISFRVPSIAIRLPSEMIELIENRSVAFLANLHNTMAQVTVTITLDITHLLHKVPPPFLRFPLVLNSSQLLCLTILHVRFIIVNNTLQNVIVLSKVDNINFP